MVRAGSIIFDTRILILVPGVSPLLYLYSGIQEAVRQPNWLLTILPSNSVLPWHVRGTAVNDGGMSKFDTKPYIKHKSVSYTMVYTPCFEEVYFNKRNQLGCFGETSFLKVELYCITL